jgi:hypothetical protein
MDRRTTIKWMLAASASMPLITPRVSADSVTAKVPVPQGYGTDPVLTRLYHRGELWPLRMTQQQRTTAAALCDAILPADEVSPSASSVGVVDFLAEWVSAPYDQQKFDRKLILEGLAWIDAESQRRFGRAFHELNEKQQHAICDDICTEERAKPHYAKAANFFARYRDLTAGGYYTSPAGRKDVQYIGNVPLKSFDGPPQALLQKLGLADVIVQGATQGKNT